MGPDVAGLSRCQPSVSHTSILFSGVRRFGLSARQRTGLYLDGLQLLGNGLGVSPERIANEHRLYLWMASRFTGITAPSRLAVGLAQKHQEPFDIRQKEELSLGDRVDLRSIGLLREENVIVILALWFGGRALRLLLIRPFPRFEPWNRPLGSILTADPWDGAWVVWRSQFYSSSSIATVDWPLFRPRDLSTSVRTPGRS